MTHIQKSVQIHSEINKTAANKSKLGKLLAKQGDFSYQKYFVVYHALYFKQKLISFIH